MPNAAAISSEYVPSRQRPFAVTLTIVCIPLGGSLAGFIGGRSCRGSAGARCSSSAASCRWCSSLLLLRVLPESPRFLARHEERWPELRALLRRLGHQVA